MAYDSSRSTTNGAIFLRLLAYPLFLASGAAGLIYEVVWNRVLLNTFGAGLYAVTAVVAAFMAGLALGAWLLGSLGDRIGRPLRLYGALELGVALCGGAAPFILPKIAIIDQYAYHVFGQNFGALTALRFIVAFMLMLIPTTLMGATLPVMSRFMVRQKEHLGLHVGALYATNTFGAVIGTFAAGFYLIGLLGLRNTDLFAATLNTAVGLSALILSMGLERVPMSTARVKAAVAATEAGAPSLGVVRWVLFTALVSGVVSLAAQVLWSRTLIFSFVYLKNTTYAFSAMLTVFLAGLALGSALVGLFVDSQKNPLRLYGMLLSLLGVSIIMSVVVLHTGADALQIGEALDAAGANLNWPLAVANVMVQSLGVLGIPTLLMGMAFPVAARVVTQIGRVGTDVGRLYALNTIGSIIGSLLAAFVIIPALGLTGGLILLGIVDAAIGLATMWRAGQARMHLVVLAPLTIGMTILALSNPQGLQRLGTVYDKLVFYLEGPLATVSVISSNLDEETIYVDDVGVAGTDPVLQTDQKSLAHVPMMLLENPTAALTVGFGSGGASYSLQLHDALRKVHCVEICQEVPRAAPYLAAANHLFFARSERVDAVKPGVYLARSVTGKDGETVVCKASTRLTAKMLATIKAESPDPEVLVGDPFEFGAGDDVYRIILDDARAYLRYTEQRYDFIATDCTDLRYKSNANLYDVEYFKACEQRLTPDGIVVVWMPLAGLDPAIFKTALRTFHHVFPKMGVFYMDNEPTHYILLIGWQGSGPIKLDYRLFKKRLAEPDVLQDLAELHLDDPVKLLSCFITGGDAMNDYLKGEELNTENDPVIEFQSPRYGYGPKPVIDNLQGLMDIRVSPRKFIVEGSMPPEDLARLERYEKALPYIIQGHAAMRNTDIEGATRAYLAARQITPDDISVANLLTFPILQKRLEKERSPLIALWLGRSLMIQGKIDGAFGLIDQARKTYEASQAMPARSDEARRLDAGRLELARQWLAEIDRQRAGAGAAE
ncbi:MAG: fused MFS/spermidine synthase [Candidatus Sumerlaeia bacterium]